MKRLFILLIIFATIFTGCSSKTAVRKQKQKTVKTALIKEYKKWKGTPYRMGGTTKRGVDCSAFTQIIYRDALRAYIPRTTQLQVQVGQYVKKRKLRTGDLVFFKIDRRTRHVGIYIGDEQFMHASSSRGVMISKFSNYWNKRYWTSRRIL